MPYPSDESTRPLEFPLYNSASESGDTPEGEEIPVFVWEVEDPDERVLINLEVSLNEYVGLATAIDVGRDIAYNEDSFKIWWLWIRAYKMVEWCAHIIDCIQNDADTQAALAGWLASSGNGVPGENMPASKQTEDMGGIWNDGCNPDITWAQSVAMVTRANTAIVDLLESLSEATTVSQIAGVLASLPLIENLGLTTLTNLAQLLIGLPLSAYNDDYTTAWAEALECEIFCAAKEDCIINFIDVWSILRLRVEPEVPTLVPPDPIWNIVGWANEIFIQASALLELNKADVMFYFLFGGLAYGNVIINQNAIGKGILETALMLAADEPNNDWEVLCEDCPEEIAPALGITPDSACLPGTVYGENLIFNSEDGIWEADGLVDPTTNTMRVAIVRSDGGLFQYNTFTASVGIGGAGWVTEDLTCAAGAGLMPPEDTNLYCMLFAIVNNGTPLHIGFNFISV